MGDRFELRGPIGGYFVWDPNPGGAVLLVGGGSGVVPLMAMVRQRAADGDAVPTRLLYSAKSWDDVIYRDELERQGNAVTASRSCTRSRASNRRAGRATAAGSTGSSSRRSPPTSSR